MKLANTVIIAVNILAITYRSSQDINLGLQNISYKQSHCSKPLHAAEGLTQLPQITLLCHNIQEVDPSYICHGQYTEVNK